MESAEGMENGGVTELSLGEAARNSGMNLWDYVRWKKEQRTTSDVPVRKNVEVGTLNNAAEIEEKIKLPLKDKKPRLYFPSAFTYDYPNKNSWRAEWFNFLKQHLSVTSETKVLFFPGAEALEIPGYDKLGIRRENMYGIERNPKAAASLRAKELGITLVEGDLYDFLQTTPQRFSAVLLDYEGGISEEKVRSLELLVQQGLLEEKSILGINLLAKREKKDEQMLYLEPYFEEKMEFLQKQHLTAGDKVPLPVLSTTHNLNGVRDYGITAILLKMFMGKDAVKVNRSLLEMLPSNERKAWLSYLAEKSPSCYHDFLQINEELRNYLDTTIDNSTLKTLAVVVGLAHSQPYFVEGMRRVSYLNARGNNHYYSDFYALNWRQELFDVLKHSRLEKLAGGKQKMVNFEQQYARLPLPEQKRLRWELSKAADALGIAYAEFFVSERIPDREMLRGEAVPFSEEHREEVIKLLQQGLPNHLILQKYSGLGKSNLAGYRANITRGSYN